MIDPNLVAVAHTTDDTARALGLARLDESQYLLELRLIHNRPLVARRV